MDVQVDRLPDVAGGFWLVALLGFLVWLVLVGGLITLVVLGIRWLLRNTGSGLHAPGPPTAHDSALATLRERYARGEIDATEFEERKRTLGG
jgi:putative membrane protein